MFLFYILYILAEIEGNSYIFAKVRRLNLKSLNYFFEIFENSIPVYMFRTGIQTQNQTTQNKICFINIPSPAVWAEF